MASIYRRNGKYTVTYVDVDGKQYRISTGTTDKVHAMLWKNQAENLVSQARNGIIDKVGRIDAGTVLGKVKKECLTLSEFREKYADRCRDDLEVSPSTISLNRLALMSLVDVVGDKRLYEVSDTDILKWKKILLDEGKSRTTVAIYFRHLRASFNKAIKWKYFAGTNPLNEVEAIKDIRTNEEKAKDLSEAEVKLLLDAIDKEDDTTFGNYVRFLLYTGCRRNEILRLRWENLDLVGKTMRVYQEKTKKTLVLPITEVLFRVIQGMGTKNEGYLFTPKRNRKGEDGNQPINKDYLTHHFKQYITKLGLSDKYSLHSTRHTFTNVMLKRGVPLEIVQRMLGHSNIRVTQENYDNTRVVDFREANQLNFEVA